MLLFQGGYGGRDVRDRSRRETAALEEASDQGRQTAECSGPGLCGLRSTSLWGTRKTDRGRHGLIGCSSSKGCSLQPPSGGSGYGFAVLCYHSNYLKFSNTPSFLNNAAVKVGSAEQCVKLHCMARPTELAFLHGARAGQKSLKHANPAWSRLAEVDRCLGKLCKPQKSLLSIQLAMQLWLVSLQQVDISLAFFCLMTGGTSQVHFWPS